MEVLGGEMVLEVDGFVVVLEAEFTCVLVKVKGLGGAGALREPMDSNSSFPVTLTPRIVLAALGYTSDLRSLLRAYEILVMAFPG